jgi:hypothetical protein
MNTTEDFLKSSLLLRQGIFRKSSVDPELRVAYKEKGISSADSGG